MANALNLYLTTCKYIIQSNPNDQETWVDLYRLLPCLRQSLSCSVCSQILHDPRGPISACHFVCAECVDGKMKLKQACSMCKDRSSFCENRLLNTVVLCYKKLCEYVASVSIAGTLAAANNGSTNTLLALIQEGRLISSPSKSQVLSKGAPLPPKLQKFDTSAMRANKGGKKRFQKSLFGSNRTSVVALKRQNSKKTKRSKKSLQFISRQIKDFTNSSSASSVETIPATTRTPLVGSEHDYEGNFSFISNDDIDKSSIISRLNDLNDLELQTAAIVDVSSSSLSNKQIKKEKPQGCRCGMATSNPGQLTCCGQRCPCYSAFLGCVNCRCRGCRNPRGDPNRLPQLHHQKLIINDVIL